MLIVAVIVLCLYSLGITVLLSCLCKEHFLLRLKCVQYDCAKWLVDENGKSTFRLNNQLASAAVLYWNSHKEIQEEFLSRNDFIDYYLRDPALFENKHEEYLLYLRKHLGQ